MAKSKDFQIKDGKMAESGSKKIEWAGSQMKVLRLLEDDYLIRKPFKNLNIGCCLHVTSETANLMLALKKGGANVSLCASNPLSTQDDVAAALAVKHGIKVYAIHGEDNKTYYRHIDAVLEGRPQITMDDGADLVSKIHKDFRIKKEESGNGNRFLLDKTWEFYGSSEETTTGVIRLKAMEKEGALKIPVVAVNDSDTKHLFDNRYGTGQSTVDGLIRATNILIAGKKAVVAGYGWCARGVAMRLRGMGALVTVTEVDPVKALEAVMDGFAVDRMAAASKYADIFITVTGNKHVITLEHMKAMKEGAIVANSGHFNVEIDYEGIKKYSKSSRYLRNALEEIVLKNGKKIYILGEGRLVNLVAAEGHPAEVMDMSFANQAMAAEFFVRERGKLQPRVYVLPKSLDRKVASLKLKSLSVKYDTLTGEQKKYLESWKEGT